MPSSLTLTIGGVDYLPQYKTNSLSIREQLKGKGNVANFILNKKPNDTAPVEGKEVIFKDGNRFLFAGFISRLEPIEYGAGELIRYNVEVTDYTYILTNKLGYKVYKNKTLKYIVEDLLSTFVAASYGLDTTNVDTGPTLDTVSFNYISIRKCFEKLTSLTGYEWWVDYQRNIYFKAKTALSAPETITESSKNYSSINIKVDTTQLRNSIVVRGGKEETAAPVTDSFKGDGTQNQWTLREKPKTMVSITLNGVAKVFGVDPINEDTGNYFMFNFQEKYVRLAQGSPVPSASDIIAVTYNYEVPVLVRVEDASSVAAMKIIEGGDGRHEDVINDSSIDSKKEGRLRGMRQLAEFANPLMTATLQTRTSLLQAGSYFIPGQVITVNLPTWGILQNTNYLIQEINTSLYEDGNNIEYIYTVIFGGRLLGVKEFLESLASQEVIIDEDEQVDIIKSISEVLTLTEVITRNQNTRNINESINLDESVTMSKTTPPFKWTPSGTKKGVWGKAEWG